MLEHHIKYWDEEKTIKRYEFWTLDDRLHKEDGPAHITYYPNGNVYCKSYYLNGELHNLKGPTCIFYDKDREIDYEYYYIEGIQYSKTKWRKLRKEF